MTTWSDLGARARGLATRLLPAERMAALAASPDLDTVAMTLAGGGWSERDGEGGHDPQALELAVRRAAAHQWLTLMRWAGGRARVLAVVTDDEDRRSLRALVRGALQGAPARVAGLIPTPSLPERALVSLARARGVDAVGAQLVTWGHPFGPAVSAAAGQRVPDPLSIELEVNATFARRATRSARRGGRALREYVREVIDLENAQTALALTERPSDVDRDACFLAGGVRLTANAFRGAADAASRGEAGRLLAAALAGWPLATPIARYASNPSRLERALLAAQLIQLERRRHIDPLGPLPVLGYVLALRAQVMDLQRIIWGVALGAPRDALVGPAMESL